MPGPRSTAAWQQARARCLAKSTVCWICGKPGATTVDHIVPLSKGGSLLDPSNLRPCCHSCNSARGNRDIVHVARNSRKW